MGGMKLSSVTTFLELVDTDGDSTLSYDEFLEWVMKPSCSFSEDGIVRKIQSEESKLPAHQRTEENWEELEAKGEVTMHMVKELIQTEYINFGVIPKDWPPTACLTLTNLKARFPQFPVRDMIPMMIKKNYVGGMVIPLIRKTRTLEVEMTTIVQFQSKHDGKEMFPAKYKTSLTSSDQMHVYDGDQENFSLIKMRDGKFPPIATIPPNTMIMILEVQQGQEYGFNFGKIDWKGNANCWVNLGLVENIEDLHFTEATRVWN